MKSKGSSDCFCSVSAVKIRPKEGDTYFDVIAVVDPVTRDAQKLAPLLLVGCRASGAIWTLPMQTCCFRP